MLQLFLLFLPLVVVSAFCPQGYYDGGDGSCYSNLHGRTTRNWAYNQCGSSGGYLPDALNAFQNNALQQRAGNSSGRIWLGLTCTGNDVQSCAWDYGTDITYNRSYNNFYRGAPQIDLGSCVYMDVQTGYWYSGVCAQSLDYICKYNENRSVPLCQGYQGANAFTFRNQCYVAIANTSFNEAKSACRDQCGTVTSIHTPGENNYIGSVLYDSYIQFPYMFIGLQLTAYTNSSYSWDDNSAVNYTNFGYENRDIGQCVAMALENDLIQVAQWINTDCGGRLPAVCKRDLVTACDHPTTIPPTLAPTDCASPYFYSGDGTIYSPGYPVYFYNNSCEYLITESTGQTAVIHFSELYLTYGSQLTFYSGITDTTPFETIDYYTNNNRTVYSPTNLIRMYYTTRGNSSWVAEYGTSSGYTTTYRPVTTTATTTAYPGNGTYGGCNSTYYGNGYFQSENYPNPYPQQLKNCSYIVQPASWKTCVFFESFDIRNGDSVTVYDPTINYQLARLTIDNPPRGPYCTTTYQPIVVTLYSSDWSFGYGTGFQVKYGSEDYIGYGQTTAGTTATPGWANTTATTAPSPCGNTYYQSGTIQSANFPYGYPAVTQSCSYYLSALSDKTCILFDTYQIRLHDSLTLYDGRDSGIIIASFSLYSTPQQVYCSYYYNTMTVVLASYQNNYESVIGFKARFAASASELLGSPTGGTTVNPTEYSYTWKPQQKDGNKLK